MNKQRRLLSLCLSALILCVSGCSFYKLPDLENHCLDAYYSEDAVVYKTLYSSETMSLNYLGYTILADNIICANVIDTLIDYDSNNHELPGLALSWEPNEEGTVWTFHLRDDATWVDYNGDYYADVVADDWVCAAEFVKEEGLAQTIDFTVEAPDEKTLVYTLKKPCPFFTSMLSYSVFLPVCRSYLEKCGTSFARDHQHLLYCGAYVLNYFQPFEKQILVKNPNYWDKNNVFIDRVENYYDYDASEMAVKQFLEGKIDKAVIPYTRLSQYLADPEISKSIHKPRPDGTYTYFYSFNFFPQFDEKYDPDNWAKAVVNENFRKAIASSLDRVSLLAVYEPNTPEYLVSNTITPPLTLFVNGTDYTSLNAFNAIVGRDSFSVAQARYYKKKAKEELAEDGVKFPIKILMPYDPSKEGWVKEAYLAEAMIESILGRNFVDVIVEAGNDTGFTTSVIESGKYAFTKCRWGANYSDPLTWADAFTNENECTFWNRCNDSKIRFLNAKWNFMIQDATAITFNQENRYNAFAEAEKLLINNAIVVPLSSMYGNGYEMNRLNVFEAEYAPYGIACSRYKNMHLYDKSMNMDEYNEAYAEWFMNFFNQ